MNRNAIIIQEKSDYLIEAISNILSIYFNLKPTIVDFENTSLDSIVSLPEIVFVDEKILMNNCSETIKQISNKFSEAVIIILSLGNIRNIETLLSGYENVEKIDLWDTKISTINKINNIIRKNKLHLSRMENSQISAQ